MGKRVVVLVDAHCSTSGIGYDAEKALDVLLGVGPSGIYTRIQRGTSWDGDQTCRGRVP